VEGARGTEKEKPGSQGTLNIGGSGQLGQFRGREGGSIEKEGVVPEVGKEKTGKNSRQFRESS